MTSLDARLELFSPRLESVALKVQTLPTHLPYCVAEDSTGASPIYLLYVGKDAETYCAQRGYPQILDLPIITLSDRSSRSPFSSLIPTVPVASSPSRQVAATVLDFVGPRFPLYLEQPLLRQATIPRSTLGSYVAGSSYRDLVPGEFTEDELVAVAAHMPVGRDESSGVYANPLTQEEDDDVILQTAELVLDEDLDAMQLE